MAELLRWGIMGTGRIASVFTSQLARSKTGKAVAVASRTQESVDKFAAQYNIPRVYSSYTALLDDPDVDIVYISTPHHLHARWSIAAAEAEKHILCEKPLALNFAEASSIVEAARRNDVFLMEAFMYRCHPQTARLVKLLREQIIGDVRVIQATFSFHSVFDLAHRTLNHALAGGGILDVGCYCVSMARLVAGIACGKDFEEPTEVHGCGCIGDKSRVDEYAIASLYFPGNILAQLATGVQVNMENVVRIFGTDGYMVIPRPWVVSIDGGTSYIHIYKSSATEPEVDEVTTNDGLFTIEADTVARYIHRRQAETPAMCWDDSLGNMKTLDLWRQAIGLIYDMERIM